MTLALVRLDDRLIHGQVVIGWGNALRAQAILLIDDGVHESEWEQDLYRMGVPSDLDLEFSSSQDAATALARWERSPKRTIVLLSDVTALARVCQGTTVVKRVNLGGLHDKSGRSRRLRYVYLSDDEAKTLRELAATGIEISAQDVPTAESVPLKEVL